MNTAGLSDQTGARHSVQRLPLAALLLMLIVGAGLRLVDLDRQGLWVDEGFTAHLTARPVAEYGDALLSDTAPPLYYYLVRPAALLAPGNTFALRLPAAVFGIVSILLIYLLAVELLGNRWAGVVAAAVLAGSRLHIVHSQEARHYTLYFMLALVMMFCAARLARRPIIDPARKRLALWAGLVLAGAGVVYTHNIGWFCVAGILLFYPLACLVRGERRGGVFGYVPLIETVIAGLLILLLYMPWLPVFVFQSKHVMHDYWIDRRTLVRFLADMARLVWLPVHAPSSAAVGWHAYAAGGLVVLLVWGFGLFGIASWLRRRRDARFAALAVGLAAGMLSVLLISQIAQPVFMEKVVIFFLAVPLLGVAALATGPAHGRAARLRHIAAGLTVSVVLVAAVTNHGLTYHEQWREATQWAIERAEPHKEPLVVDACFHLMAVAWHIQDTPYGPAEWNRTARTVLHHVDAPPIEGDPPMDGEGSVIWRLRHLIRPGKRVWLIQRGQADGLDKDLVAFLWSVGREVERNELFGVTVRAFMVERLPTTQPRDE